MGKRPRVIRVIQVWCRQPPAQGTDRLEDLWLRHGPAGVPFNDEGAERLIGELDKEFPGNGLRVVDVLDLTFDGLVNAIPNGVAAATLSRAAVAPAAVAPASAAAASNAASGSGTAPAFPPLPPASPTVALTDETIERLATRIAALLRPTRSSRRKAGATARFSSGGSGSRSSGKRSAKGSGRKPR